MERRDFFGHYRICMRDDALHVLNRTGPAINYKAIDTRSADAVVLQLIPRAIVDQIVGEQFKERVARIAKVDHVNVSRVLGVEHDDDYLGLVSEYVAGETAESWVVTHGPMPADGVLRIGLQVVRALGAAAFQALSHRAIEPANIMIVRGQTAEGGWPFVKLLNFGLAGLAIYDEKIDKSQFGPAPAPQFASPEQLVGKPTDFRSEIYSLGATMCFLLTGAVPLAVGGMKARLRARRLPELRRAPRQLRNLLVHMLRENPENRPQDPVLFEKEIQNCLATIERRQALGRRFGLPLAAVIPRKTRSTIVRSTSGIAPTEPFDEIESRGMPSAMTQVIRGTVAFAALVLIGGIVAAFLLPEDVVPFHKRSVDKIGVPVGVPSPAQVATTASQPPAVASNASSPAPAASAVDSPPPQAVAQASEPEPPPPAQGPDESQSSGVAENNSVAQNSVENNPPNESTADTTSSDEPRAAATPVKKKTARSTSTTTTSRRSSASSSSRDRSANDEPRTTRHGEVHARYVGSTPDGRMILRLPSGRTVAVRPGHPDEDVDLGATARRRVNVPRDADAPYQPFDPDGPRD